MTEHPLPENEAPEGPIEVAAFIADVVRGLTRSRRHRGPIHKDTLRSLCQWEREVSDNYGVERKPEESGHEKG